MINTKGEFFLAVAKSGIHPMNITSNLCGDNSNILSFEVSSYDKKKLEVLKKNLGVGSDITQNGIMYTVVFECDVEDVLTTEDCVKIDSAIRGNKLNLFNK